MLFLGAGASKPLGVPTMEEFTEVILKDLGSQGKDLEPLVRGIQTQITGFNLKPDIEAVMTVLDGKRKPKKALEDIGASVILFAERYRNIPEDLLAAAAIEQIAEAIYQRCVRIDHKAAIRLLGGLWDALYANIAYPVARNNVESAGVGPLLKIFTTNYDLAVETFLKSRNYGFDDGFHQDAVGDDAFDGTWGQGRVNLFKLHGSVNYFLKGDGKVTRSESALGEADLFGRSVKERRMIYPTGEKYATRSPYYEYLGQLRQALATEQVCIIIGYSFRDTPINNAFLDAIQKNPKIRILVVGPSADRVKSSLDKDLQRNILALNGAVGNSLLPQSILEQFSLWPLPWPPPSSGQ